MAILKNTSADGIAIVPSAFKLEEVTITNGSGQAVDVSPLVTEISITESIYSPSLICKVSVRDEANLIAVLPIYGFETVRVRLSRKEGVEGGEQEVDHIFYVTEYPLYGRPDKQHSQAWTLVGISKEIYKAECFKYCAGLEKDSIETIKELLESLEIEADTEKTNKGKKLSGFIPMQSPMTALNWLKRKGAETPLYFYQTLDGEYRLAEHQEIVEDAVYREYTHSRDYSKLPGSQEDYEERKKRMLEVASELNLGKYNNIKNGTFGKTIGTIDLGAKSFDQTIFSYDDVIKKTLLETSVLEEPASNQDSSSDEQGASIDPNENEVMDFVKESFNSKHEWSTQNPENAYGSNPAKKSFPTTKSIDTVLDTIVHDVKVFGDFYLNAGKIVELKFPESKDPEGNEVIYDENLSGKYIVTSVVHKFKNQEYHSEFRAKRDSFSEK